MTLYANTDGASRGNPGESGIGIILRDERGTVVYSGSGYIGRTTNNAAEYQALLSCLKKAIQLGCSKLIIRSDSELMVRQLKGEYRVKDKNLQRYHAEANRLIASAPFVFEVVHVEREKNRDADLLANSGIDGRRKLKV